MRRILTESDRKTVRDGLWEKIKYLDLPRRVRKLYLEMLFNRWEERWRAAMEREDAEREQQQLIKADIQPELGKQP